MMLKSLKYYLINLIHQFKIEYANKNLNQSHWMQIFNKLSYFYFVYSKLKV